MLVSTLQPRFDSLTGKPTRPRLTPSGWLCDFCGVLHKSEEEEVVSYAIIESGNIEPCFHELRIPSFENINVYTLFANHPHFQYCTSIAKFCEAAMLKAAMLQNRPITKICHIMWDARIAMLTKVLKAGTYTFAELNLDQMT